MKKQVFNPYLPLNEYIPDGEPHVFGDRVYIYGSHDKEDGETFCMFDYVTWSAPVTDLSDWRFEGVIYKASQDPDYNERPYMYAPDVVQGNDGRFYLYYCMSGKDGVGGYHGPISVAVADSPVGPFEYIGFVRNPDGTPMKDYVCFDPGVLNDNGTIRVYYGTRYEFEEETNFGPVNACGEVLSGDNCDSANEAADVTEKADEVNSVEKTKAEGNEADRLKKAHEESERGLAAFLANEALIKQEMEMFGKSREEIVSMAKKDSVMSPAVVALCDDMLTVKEPAKHIIPYRVKGTSFETHPFFEASSMRKVGDKYYFIYSSRQNHELCYAVSDHPDRDFIFCGTIVSNGDIGMYGRCDDKKLNMTGTTHGSIIEINGEWYVFFHRLTHKSDYSRQSCAEKIKIEADGSIKQVPITSCGLNGGPLEAAGSYPAAICMALTNGKVPHGCNRKFSDSFPNVSSAPKAAVSEDNKAGSESGKTQKTSSDDLKDTVSQTECSFINKEEAKTGFTGMEADGRQRFVSEIQDGTLIGYRYFDFKGKTKLTLTLRNSIKVNAPAAEGCFEIRQSLGGTGFETEAEKEDVLIAKLEIKDLVPSNDQGEWTKISVDCDFRPGVSPLYLFYRGNGVLDLLELDFS